MLLFIMVSTMFISQPVYAVENDFIPEGKYIETTELSGNQKAESEDESTGTVNVDEEEKEDELKAINNLEAEESEKNDVALHDNSPYAITVMLNDQQAELQLTSKMLELCPDSKETNDIKQNSNNLQAVIDAVSNAGGGTVTLPLGTYYFYPTQKNFNEKNSILTSADINYVNYYVIKCRDNVTVNGSLNEDNTVGTILCPVAHLAYPVDMFYFADIIDKVENKYDETQAKWLVNADFNNFVIDYSNTENYGYYNAKGKGFYIVLLRDCDWNNVTVKYTEGTGFGVDCPVNCTIRNCTAIACGKQATSDSVGGSGFGIGFGYSDEESMLIENCLAEGNRKFGFFFENQARFEKYYQAKSSKGFRVVNCVARGNMYNFGGEMCSNTYYIDCTSEKYSTNSNLLNVSNQCAYYFGTQSTDYHIIKDGVEINKYVANKEYYTDVNGWFVTEGWFDKILESEIMYGYSKANGDLTYIFGQEDAITRGQVAVMLYRYSHPNKVESTNVKNTTPFIDNKSNVFYTEAMNWAYEQGILTGYKNADGTLGKYIKPENNITREELATVFYRFAEKNGADVANYDKQAYMAATDAYAVSFWAKESIAWCYSNRIMTGGALDGRLNPVSAATRGQAAKMILQMLNTL